MERIGAYEAKTHRSSSLDRVQKGEAITITRHGKAVARLIPVPGSPDRTAAEATEALRAFRKDHTLGPDVTVKDLIEEGRGR